ncbi:MAG: DnaJ-like protein [Verrucomicrobiales bacterium]|nr:DnaJ-like protein [Verrucomicrobiales bacterium]
MNPSIERYLAMVQQHPGNELARFSLGKAYFDDGQFDQAKEQFHVALEKKPEWMVVQILLGKCFLARENRAEAIASFKRARQLALEQKHESPLAEMDQLLHELGETGKNTGI